MFDPIDYVFALLYGAWCFVAGLFVECLGKKPDQILASRMVLFLLACLTFGMVEATIFYLSGWSRWAVVAVLLGLLLYYFTRRWFFLRGLREKLRQRPRERLE
jgi:hypothetical protein